MAQCTRAFVKGENYGFSELSGVMSDKAPEAAFG